MVNIKVHNKEPTYITSNDVIKQEDAETLIELVNERGKKSEWSYNPQCYELQIANPFAKIRTPNDEKIIGVLPTLFQLGEDFLRTVNLSFQNSVCDTVTGHHGFWILKYESGAEFEAHCDWDSGPNGIRPPIVATVAISLNEQFRGGETILFSSCGSSQLIKRPKYSAIAWDGFTQHRVAAVTEGTRYALVIHYTGTLK